jgi:hypothetical protein
MSRWISVILAVALIVILPATLVLVEYTRDGPGFVKVLPDHGVHLAAGAQKSLEWLSHWSWARMWVRWDEIQTQPGTYTWDATLDDDLTALRSQGVPTLLTLITTPEWARINPQVRCSPPQPDYLDDYAAFINAVIDRYQPQAVELTNEPEVSHETIGNLDQWMGCWGPEGSYYAEMLRTVYPLIKDRHPGVIVAAGSLMLDEEHVGFWKDVLSAGGGGFYDAVSFHNYIYYPLNEYQTTESKAEYLRSLGESAPLWLTETSLLCYDEFIECGEEFQQAQADYYRYISKHHSSMGVERFFWFTLANNEWRHSDLVENRQLKPAWYEYQKVSSILNRSVRTGR